MLISDSEKVCGLKFQIFFLPKIWLDERTIECHDGAKKLPSLGKKKLETQDGSMVLVGSQI